MAPLERQIFKYSPLSCAMPYINGVWCYRITSSAFAIRKDKAYNLLYTDRCGRYYTATCVYHDNTMSNCNGLCLTIRVFQIHFWIHINDLKIISDMLFRLMTKHSIFFSNKVFLACDILVGVSFTFADSSPHSFWTCARQCENTQWKNW